MAAHFQICVFPIHLLPKKSKNKLNDIYTIYRVILLYIGYVWNWLIEIVYLTYIFLCFSRIQGSRHEIGWWFQRKKTSRNYTGTMFIIIFIFWLCWMKWTFPMGWMYLAQFFLDVLHLWINVISDEIFHWNKFKLIA